jgi:hypothetical protein
MTDVEAPLESSELDQLWGEAQVAQGMDPSFDTEFASRGTIQAGVAAVLLRRGGTWLSEYPERAVWARRVVLDCITEHGEDSIYGSGRDQISFAISALPRLWIAAPHEPDVRTTVARLALRSPSEDVRAFAQEVARFRKRLGDDHLRFIRAVLLRASIAARMRVLAERKSWLESEEKQALDKAEARLQTEMDLIEAELAAGTLRASIPSLAEIAPASTRIPSPHTSSQHRPRPRREINESLLIAAFAAIPDPDGDQDTYWFTLWKNAVEDNFTPLRQAAAEETDEPEKGVGQWDQYLAERVARIVAGLSQSRSSGARDLWLPILELGASAESWVSWFMGEWTRIAITPDAADGVVETWLAMLDVALGSLRWSAAGGVTYLAYKSGQMWRTAMGLNDAARWKWTEELRPLARRLEGRLHRWANEHLVNSENVIALASFLAAPAAIDIVPAGLRWLHDAMLRDARGFWGWREDRTRGNDAIFGLLVVAWDQGRAQLWRDAAALEAFRGLLKHLVGDQYGPAFELADRVGEARP